MGNELEAVALKAQEEGCGTLEGAQRVQLAATALGVPQAEASCLVVRQTLKTVVQQAGPDTPTTLAAPAAPGTPTSPATPPAPTSTE